MASLLPQRHVRIIRFHSRRWQKRVIFMAGGLVVGGLAVVMALAADQAQAGFRAILHRWPYAAFLMTPAGFALAVFLATRYFPNSQGSGVPQVIAARRLRNVDARAKLVGVRVAIGKMLLTLLGLFVGASTGREGPTVQIGASVMFAIGRFSPRQQPGLLLAGAAAGVAAAFNTPLAGIVFAIEELSRSFEERTNGVIIGAVILAGLTSLLLFSDYAYFGSSSASLTLGTSWLAAPVCGVVGGLAGGLFSRILIGSARGVKALGGEFAKRRPVVFAALCGLAVAVIGTLSGGLVYGTGYEEARQVVHEAGNLPLYYAPLKFLATTVSSISGIPGGIFSPSLSVGAGIGADIARFFPDAPSGAIVLLGMAAYFSGVVRAPITSFVIVSEMTNNHSLLVPLMLATLIAQAASRLVCREGLYHALSLSFAPLQPKETVTEEPKLL